jgi:hypothetical protein
MNNDQTNAEFCALPLIDDGSSPDEQSKKAFNEKLARSEKVAQIGKSSRKLGCQKCEILTAFSTVFVRIGLFLIVSPFVMFIVTLLVSEKDSAGVGWALLMFLMSFFILVPFGFLFLIVADLLALRARGCVGAAHRG